MWGEIEGLMTDHVIHSHSIIQIRQIAFETFSTHSIHSYKSIRMTCGYWETHFSIIKFATKLSATLITERGSDYLWRAKEISILP